MKQILGYILLVHSAVSLSRLRKHQQQFDQTTDSSIPLDILVEVVLGCMLNLFSAVWASRPFEDIYAAQSGTSLDKTMHRPSFRSTYYNKTYLMPSYYKSFLPQAKALKLQ